MSSVPYLYVNVAALCCYALMLLAFLAARKSAPIKHFIVMLVGFILWTGGSILMRLQVFPGVPFWYYVSIMALFSLALLIYFFVCSFVRLRGYLMKIVWSVTTAVILVLTALGVFLAPPTVQTLANGSVVFTYTWGWPIIIPFIYFLTIVAHLVKIFLAVIKEKGIHTPGLKAIIAGCLAVVLGNFLQIIPGNTFPWDTLSGLFFALFLMVALYRKRMFRLTLVVSRGALMAVCGLVCILCAVYFVSPLLDFIRDRFQLTESAATIIVVILFTALLAGVYMLLKKLLDTLFTREEQQSKLLNDFSTSVSQTLNSGEIMDKLVNVILAEVGVEKVFICLPRGDRFEACHGSNPLDSTAFSISASSPCLTYLRRDESYFIVSEFMATPLYLSMWESEKELFRRLDLGCVVALKDGEEIVGLILLPRKDRGAAYSFVDLTFLTTVSSIASIAVKNASLYEWVYQEARTDSLTGLYNYKFFTEKLDECYALSGGDCLSLLYLDVDDFKLYNQLYGSLEGNEVLCRLADILRRLVADQGTVFRHSGKVFAVLMPGCDARQAMALATEFQRQVGLLNGTPERRRYKPLTVSGGICVSPYSASNAKELAENADLAVYHAKTAGKNRIIVFKGGERYEPLSVSERAMDIIERKEQGTTTYGAFSSTVYALTAAIDAKDRYTHNHSQNVAKYAAILATAAGLGDEQVRIVYEAGLLHDIGKISVPESILSKPGALTDEEFAIMRGHVNNSIEMIRHLPSMDYVIPAVLGHHERWDGKGYPRGLAGEQIPVLARCLAIADAFDAMTTNRPYRKALSLEYAADQIERGAGTQFDPELAVVFVGLLRSREIDLN